MRINIYGGFKSIINILVLSVTVPFIIMSLILIFIDGSTSTQIIASVVTIFVLCTIDVLIIKFYKPKSDSINGKIYYYLEKRNDETFILIDDSGNEEPLYDVLHIVYIKLRFKDYINIIEFFMPKNIKVICNVDGKEVERAIGNITNKELKRLKNKSIIFLQEKGQLVEY